MTRLLKLLTISLFAFALSASAQEPPKPPKSPQPGQADPPKKPAPPKRSYFCADKSDGWYCGENNEPKMFFCRSGFIEDGKDCPAGCDTGRRRCKTESK